MASKYVLALSSILFRPRTRAPLARLFSSAACPPPNLDYTVSHWLPDPSADMTSSPPLMLSPIFTDENPFPSLPSIRQRDIRTRVFTHRSFYARPNHVFEDHPDDPSPDNEK